MRYNTGSEVYTQRLCQALADRHEVHVFSRQENASLSEHALQYESNPADPRITIHVVNMARARDSYSQRNMGLSKLPSGRVHLTETINPRDINREVSLW